MTRGNATPWAMMITFFVIIAFGAFWYYERSHTTLPQTAPLNTTALIPAEPQGQADDLQAAVNIAIPDYSKDF